MAAPREADPGPAGARFFCTAGRGLEPFLLREVRERLAATQVEYTSGKVFFSTRCGLGMLKKLKSAERLFLLITKLPPLAVHRGKIFHELQSLINDDPKSWLTAISIWKNFLEVDAKEEKLSLSHVNPLKRKAGVSDDVGAKKLKAETQPELEEEDWDGGQMPCGGDPATAPSNIPSWGHLTFRVSCRCSGAVGRACTAQEAGRVLGIALKKQFGWKADLRNPGFEIFVHLNDVYSVVGIPIFRVPLASRNYIQTAGLRSTVAWALASLADIQAGAFVLDPMCGLGTILLEAAQEWPDVYYVGADVSHKQLLGAGDNLSAAGLRDKIELFRASVTELPWPSASVDAVVSDMPFGKKFRLKQDAGSALREMERVLRVGGTLVLLLNEDPHRLFSTPLFPEDGPLNEHGLPTRRGPVPERGTGVGTSCGEGVTGTESPPGGMVCAEGMACREGITMAQPLLGSLVPVGQYCVSLGKTEAFLCKYKKGTITPGTPPEKPSTSGLVVEKDPDSLQDPGPQAPVQT
ncbi:THUMP domain-containing protein 2 [Suncus etruscus]|uniref:THUMP domain-containing protein 2 n=1 Tax=Suncus etruscus TaxID=109475 RepID=UPI002110C89E|nr:THUMP domain-containing protein 2 [Suncus etruscus]